MSIRGISLTSISGCFCCWKEVLGSITSWSLAVVRCFSQSMWATITSIIIIFAILKVERCWISDSITETTTPRPSGWGIFICAHFDYFFPFNTFWVAAFERLLPPCFPNRISSTRTQHLLFYPQQPQQEEFNTLFGLNLNKKLNKIVLRQATNLRRRSD